MNLPLALHTAAQLRRMEKAAIAAGTSGYTLMTRAAVAACRLLLERWPEANTVVIACGGGNNGGDGYALALQLQRAGRRVQVVAAQDPAGLAGEAAQAFQDFSASGIPLALHEPARTATLLKGADLIVDALLGLGAQPPLRAPYGQIFEIINASERPVLSLDLPSGLDPDTGASLPAVRAAATLTFIALKRGLFLADGPDYRGALHLDALGCEAFAAQEAPPLLRMTDAQFRGALPPRAREGHKGQYGSVLVVGGGEGMAGAVRLAGEAALRAGAGLVTVASHGVHQQAVVGARPELMFRAIDEPGVLAAMLPGFDVIATGPGLGTGMWSRQVLEEVLGARTAQQGLVLDADALNLLPSLEPRPESRDWILTPHPGEAARLLGWSGQQVQADRPAALAGLLSRWGGIIVLKGAGTLVGREGEVARLCERGNPGMAIPGMGDVLTGTIAGVLAQRRDAFAAALLGVQAHALAGDICAAGGQRGMLALEVAAELRGALARLL